MSKFNFSVDCVVFGYDADLDLKILLITKKENPNTKTSNPLSQTQENAIENNFTCLAPIYTIS